MRRENEAIQAAQRAETAGKQEGARAEDEAQAELLVLTPPSPSSTPTHPKPRPHPRPQPQPWPLHQTNFHPLPHPRPRRQIEPKQISPGGAARADRGDARRERSHPEGGGGGGSGGANGEAQGSGGAASCISNCATVQCMASLPPNPFLRLLARPLCPLCSLAPPLHPRFASPAPTPPPPPPPREVLSDT